MDRVLSAGEYLIMTDYCVLCAGLTRGNKPPRCRHAQAISAENHLLLELSDDASDHLCVPNQAPRAYPAAKHLTAPSA